MRSQLNIKSVKFSPQRFSLPKEIFIPIGTFSACGNIPYTQKNSPHRQKGPFGGEKFLSRREKISFERKNFFKENHGFDV
jgi:hypothetical protein